MKSNNSSLKRILTTASTIAIIVGAASEASAAAVRITGKNTDTSTPTTTFTGGIFNNGDSIALDVAARTITISNNFNILGIDLRGFTPTKSIVVSNTGATLGSIGNAAAGASIKLNINNSCDITLSGTATVGGVVGQNDYSGLGAVTLGSTVGGAAGTVLNITAAGNVVFTANTTINSFAGTTGNWGTLNISGGNHTFNGAIGNISKLGAVNIDSSNITFGANITATTIQLENNGTITLNTAANIIDIRAPINGDDLFGNNTGSVSTVGPNNITFHDPIGATHSLGTASFVGGGAATTLSFNGSINADIILHQDMTLDATAGNLTINSPAYTLENTTYDVGNNTITITGGQVALVGNIIIKANYTPGHVALNLTNITAANLIEAAVNSLTFEVTGGVAPQRDTVMIMISSLAAGGNISIPENKIHLTPSGLWTLSTATAGQLIYNPTLPVVQAQQAVAQALDSTGATSADLAAAKKVRIETLGGKGVITNDGSTPGAVVGQKVLHIMDPTKFTADLSTEVGANALLAILTPEIRDGFLSDYELLINESDSIVFIPQNTAAAYAIVAKDQKFMTPIMADAMIHQDTSGISQGLVQDIINVSAKEEANKVIEMSDRINAAHNASSVTLNAVSSRTALTLFQTSTFTPIVGPSNELVAEAEGIAAGSGSYDKFGIWGSINGGKATQKQRKGNDGFRSTSQAIVLGADTMINDSTSIGFAASHSMNNMKHKNNSAGNKTDASSWVGSLYGTRQLKNNWFIRGTALFNRTNINNKERRVVVGNYGIAQAKYNMISYGGEANVGVSHKFRYDIVATPTIGLRVLHNNKISYKETGTTGQNHNNISQNAMDNYSALAGLSLAKTIVKNNIAFTPEAHANFQYGINMKTPSGSFVSPLTPLQNTSFVGTKPSKLTSTYGLSLTGSNDRLECAVSADVNIAEKYVGYTGALKLKVKF